MNKRRTNLFQDALTMAKIGLLIAIPASFFLFHVYTQYRISDMGYQIAEVTREHRLLIEENKKLAIEAAVAGRSDRVESLARERFGLQYLKPDQLITVRLDDGHGVEHAMLNY